MAFLKNNFLALSSIVILFTESVCLKKYLNLLPWGRGDLDELIVSAYVGKKKLKTIWTVSNTSPFLTKFLFQLGLNCYSKNKYSPAVG